jgi:hypothetical protein
MRDLAQSLQHGLTQRASGIFGGPGLGVFVLGWLA